MPGAFGSSESSRFFSDCYLRHKDLAYRLALHKTGHPADAEDAVQAAFLRLWRKAHLPAEDGVLRALVCGTVLNVCREGQRADRRRAKREADGMHQVSHRETFSEESQAKLACVREELERLPEHYRIPVWLHHYEGLSMGELAQALGRNAHTLHSQINRGMEKLRERLAQAGFALALPQCVDVLQQLPRATAPGHLDQAVLQALAQPAAAAAGATAAKAGTPAASGKWFAKLLPAAAVLAFLGAVLLFGSAPTQPQAPASVPAVQAAESAPRRAPEPTHTEETKGPKEKPKPPADRVAHRFGPRRFVHGEGIHTLAFCPGGKEILSGGWRQAVVWNAATGAEIRRIEMGLDQCRSLFLTKDGRRLIVCDGTGAVRNQDFATGKSAWVLPSINSNNLGLALGADERRLALIGNRSVRIVNFDDGSLLGQIYTAQKEQNTVPFSASRMGESGCLSADGKWFYFKDNGFDHKSGRLMRFDAGSGEAQWTLKAKTDAFALSPDGTVLACTEGHFEEGKDWTTVLSLREASTGKVLRTCDLKGHATAVSFSPDGALIVAASYHGASVWEVATGTQRNVFESGYLETAVFSPDGKRVAAGGSEGVVYVWPLEFDSEPRETPAAVLSVAFAPDEQTLVSGDAKRRVRLWDLKTGAERGANEPLSGGPKVAVSSGSRYFATFDGATMRLRDLATRSEVRACTLDPVTLSYGFFTISADGATLSAVGTYGKYAVWDALADKVLALGKGQGAPLNSSVIRSDGSCVYLAGSDFLEESLDDRTELRGLEAKTAKPLFSKSYHWKADGISSVRALALSEDGRRLAFAGAGPVIGTPIVVADAKNGDVVLKIEGAHGHWSGYGALAFSPDGRLLASGGDDRRVVVWDLTLGAKLLDLRKHNGAVTCLAFSRDGRYLASGSNDATVIVWDLAAEAPAEAAEAGALWPGLFDNDPLKAKQAVEALAGLGDDAVAAVERGLGLGLSAPELAKAVEHAVERLGDEDFAARNDATLRLLGFGDRAAPALKRAAQEGATLEVRNQAKVVIEATARYPILSPGVFAETRAIQALECIGSERAVKLLERLAGADAKEAVRAEAQAALERIRYARAYEERRRGEAQWFATPEKGDGRF